MNDLNYGRLKVLVADDFSNFRSTVNGMLGKLGINAVDVAANGEEVLNRCQNGRYDVILCDYDLGPGRNGQQVLEELRHRSLINRKSVFIIVSADAAKDVVMAAYDCEPDDYLMKPITAKMLQQRMSRLLMQRRALGAAYAAAESGQYGQAISMLIDMSISEGRYAIAAQKLLGDMFIKAGELNKAEKLYTKALQSRQLDWARLGLAKVKQLKGELDVAGQWLEKIVEENPLYLPAYDILADNYRRLNEPSERQMALQRSVDISPRSILRQKQLAIAAEENQDFDTALHALKSVIRLGELSCHATPEDSFNFARVASKNVAEKLQPVEPVIFEALDQLQLAQDRFALSPEQTARARILEGHALSLQGEDKLAKNKLNEASLLLKRVDPVPLALSLERVAALQAVGESGQVEALVAELLDAYSYDEQALQQLDLLLSEPVSESNQELIASVNREGIELYNKNRFDDAIACFERVLSIFPKHIGVHLNIVQSLVGKLKQGDMDELTAQKTRNSLTMIESLVSPGHEHYARFERLKNMAYASLAE